jgi:chemosensory pili system protein ChpA (sensor histidine kinase/response regulator)
VAAEAPAPAESVPALDFASLDLTPAPAAADAAPPAVEITKEEALAFSFDDIVAPAAQAEPAAPEPVEEPAEQTTEESDVVIGSIVLSPAFFQIYIGECEEHIATLEREMSAIEADPVTPVSHDFMRAAHTLTSSSRTTSFDLIADVASALEKWLSDRDRFSRPSSTPTASPPRAAPSMR